MRPIIPLYLRATLFASPFLIIIGTYLILDPFGTLPYESPVKPTYRHQVTDHQRTEHLLKNYRDAKFNAFAFGNSQIQAFHSVYPSYLEDASFHDYHNPGESIRNIYNKVKLVDSLGLDIDHALLALNGPLIGNVDNSNPVYVGTDYAHHPLTSGSSYLDYHLELFSYYLAEAYFIKYLDYNIFKTYRPYMEGAISERKAKYLRSTSDDSALEDPWPESTDFYEGISEWIDGNELALSDSLLLVEMAAIFQKHQTDLIVLIPPNSEVKKLAPSNTQTLKAIFGAHRVFDLSGKNAFIRDESDFIDRYHFSPRVGRRIMDHISDIN